MEKLRDLHFNFHFVAYSESGHPPSCAEGKENEVTNTSYPIVPSKLCAYTHAVRQAHTRRLEAHINVPSENVFAHISYTSFQIQMSPGKMLHKRNFTHTQAFKNYREYCSYLSLPPHMKAA